MNEEQIEKFAIKCALGNNGGKWSEHYTEDQKEFWRNFIKALVAEIKTG